MEISFITDNRFRKLNMIFRLFGAGILPQAAKEFPMFFGKEIYLSNEIFSMSISIPHHQSVWDACFDENPESKLTEISSDIAEKLDNLEIPLTPENNHALTEAKDSIKNKWLDNETAIKDIMKSVFGFDLFRKLIIVVDLYSQSNSSFGHKLAINKDMAVIGYAVGENVLKKDPNEPICIILHELLHALISRYKIIKQFESSNTFEEALIRYFAPYGELTEKLGFHVKNSKDMYSKQVKQIKNAEGQEPIVELAGALFDYSKSKPNGITLWEFLTKKGFDKYIDTSNLR